MITSDMKDLSGSESVETSDTGGFPAEFWLFWGLIDVN
jgi:hypothetical protein